MEKDNNERAEINVKHTPQIMEIVVVRLQIYVFNKLQFFKGIFSQRLCSETNLRLFPKTKEGVK